MEGKTMKKILFFILLLPLLIQRQAAGQDVLELDGVYVEEMTQKDKPKYYFGFNLTPSSSNNLISYVLIKVFEKDTTIRFITKRNFLLQATGEQTSKANPRLENLMEKNGVQNCTGDNCSVLDNLWKLIYYYNPLNPSDSSGWSCTPIFPYSQPSKRQRTLLGIKNLSDLIYGNDAFELLKSMQDRSWISWYKQCVKEK